METNTAPVQAWPLGPSGRLIWGIIPRVLCGLRAQWLSFFHGHGITPLWRYGLTPKVANWSLNCPRELWLYLYVIAICKVIWALYSIVVKPDLPKRRFIFVCILVRVITCFIDFMCIDFNLRVCIWIFYCENWNRFIRERWLQCFEPPLPEHCNLSCPLVFNHWVWKVPSKIKAVFVTEDFYRKCFEKRPSKHVEPNSVGAPFTFGSKIFLKLG